VRARKAEGSTYDYCLIAVRFKQGKAGFTPAMGSVQRTESVVEDPIVAAVPCRHH